MTEEAKRPEIHIPNAKPDKVQTVGVIGAGVMGAQIATICAGKHLQVYMRDIKQDIVDKGLKVVSDHFEKKVARKRMTTERAQSHIGLVKGGTDVKGFSNCKLLIEAAVERMVRCCICAKLFFVLLCCPFPLCLSPSPSPRSLPLFCFLHYV